MLKFNEITKLIHDMLLKEDINYFPLSHVRKLIRFRNNLKEFGGLDYFKWFPLEYKRKYKWVKRELDLREDIFFCLSEDFKYDNLPPLSREIMDKVFYYENIILKHVGNVMSYYDMLYEMRKHKVDFKYDDKFRKWTDWEKSIDEAVEEFTLWYGLYPNVLIANEYTLSQIDFLLNTIPEERKNTFRLDEITNKQIPIEDDEEINLSILNYPDFSIRFAYNKKYDDKEFALAYIEGLNDNDEDDDDNDDDNPVNPKPSPSPKSKTIPILI